MLARSWRVSLQPLASTAKALVFVSIGLIAITTLVCFYVEVRALCACCRAKKIFARMRAMRLWRSAFTKVKNARMFVRSVEAEVGRSGKATNHKGDEADKDIENARLRAEVAQLRALLQNTAKSELLEEVPIADHAADKGTTTPKKEAAIAWGGAVAVADEVRQAEAESSQAVGIVQGP
jgi:hypothetical protein